MSNNTVDLSGHLTVKEVRTVQSAGRQAVLIEGWVQTDLPAAGGRHPFVAIGRQAEVIIEEARSNGLNLASAAEPLGFGPDMRKAVIVRGKLVSFPGHSFLDVRHISFYDTSHPLTGESQWLGRFIANSVRLQGHLIIAGGDVALLELGVYRTPLLSARIATADAESGGLHPVMFSGRIVDALFSQAAERNPAYKKVWPVTLGGRLVTVRDTIYIQADFLSLNPEAKNNVIPDGLSSTCEGVA